MKTGNRNTWVIAAVLLAGVVAALFILRMDRKTTADPHQHGHAEENPHEGKGHAHEEGEKRGHEAGPGDDHGKEGTHNHEEGHAHAEGEAHDHDEGGNHEAEGKAEAGHGRRVRIDAEALKISAIDLAVAAPAPITEVLSLPGQVTADEDRVSQVTSRFPGVVRQVKKRMGDRVRKGEVLAVVESNESLSAFELTAPLSGSVVRRNLTVGQTVSPEQIAFVIVDLSRVFVDLQVPRGELSALALGQEAYVRTSSYDRAGSSSAAAGPAPSASRSEPLRSISSAGEATGKVSYLAPVGRAESQTVQARISLSNPRGLFKPGLTVETRVLLNRRRAALAVPVEALQTLDGENVVFVKEGSAFEARTVSPSLRDEGMIEILSGLAAGDTVAARNSFILKADLGKAEAEHEH